MPYTAHHTPLLIRAGHLALAGRQAARVGDVLVRDGRVARIADTIDPTGDEEIIDARGHLVLPGLVDAHRHMWLGALSAASRDVTLFPYAARINERLGDPFTTEDVYAGVIWGALQAINAGVTTVADWAHNAGTPEDIDANLRALDDSGIRARFFFGGKASSSGDQGRYAQLARTVHADHRSGAWSARISLGLALRGPSMSSPEETRADFALARELGLPISIHAGMAGLPGAVEQLHRQDLLGPDVNYVHANEFTDREWRLVADSRGTVSSTPTVDVTMGLGLHPATGPALAHGVSVGLGADTVAYGPTDLFAEMRLALAAERSRTNAGPIGRDEMPTELASSHRDVFDMATRGGADVLGLPDVGVLAVGAAADLVTVDMTAPHLDAFGDPLLAVFLGAGPSDVSTVVINGRVLKRHGRLDTDLTAHARAHMQESRARISARIH